jgi:Kef-type K+ transport system membrane component KefB
VAYPVHSSTVTLVLLLLQIAVILIVCRLLRELAGRFGQPPVIGEMIGGLLLGPSFLGWIRPMLYMQLFPPASLPVLNDLSQIGLVLFMFLVGLHLNLVEVYTLRRAAGTTGLLSIAVPFAAGLALAQPLHNIAPSVPILPFSMFLAVSMSITAFPVLARILADQQLTAKKLGHVAVACAALNDVLAWLLLAWAVAITRSDGALAWKPIMTVAVYVTVMFMAVRPGLKWLTGRFAVMRELSTMVILVFLSSWVTELAGIHALFGAFLAGVIWPRDGANVPEITLKIEPVAMVVLVPLFFAYTGIRTHLGTLGANLWVTTLTITAVAIAAKVGGAFVGAKITGFDLRDSLALGCLLNTRGLVELVVLNVGLDLGILSQELFSMMVMMALVTTTMTAPMLRLVLGPVSRRHDSNLS